MGSREWKSPSPHWGEGWGEGLKPLSVCYGTKILRKNPLPNPPRKREYNLLPTPRRGGVVGATHKNHPRQNHPVRLRLTPLQRRGMERLQALLSFACGGSAKLLFLLKIFLTNDEVDFNLGIWLFHPLGLIVFVITSLQQNRFFQLSNREYHMGSYVYASDRPGLRCLSLEGVGILLL